MPSCPEAMMQLQVLCFSALIGSLLAVVPTNTVAQSLPDTNPLPCQIADNPTSETYCRPLADTILADTILPRGVTVVASDGSSVLVDSVRLVGTLGLDGPTVQVFGGEPVVAQSDQDELTTGSIKSNDALEVTPPSSLPSPETEKTTHTDALVSPSDMASPPAAPASASDTVSWPATALASPSALAPSSAPTSSAPAS